VSDEEIRAMKRAEELMADPLESVIATALATTYTIEISGSGFELEVFNQSMLGLSVCWRGTNSWAICRHSACLNAEGEWSYEFNPSDREDEWLAAHRFDLETALKLAQAEALRIYGNFVERFAEIDNELAQPDTFVGRERPAREGVDG
jgi:hypothetical protein